MMSKKRISKVNLIVGGTVIGLMSIIFVNNKLSHKQNKTYSWEESSMVTNIGVKDVNVEGEIIESNQYKEKGIPNIKGGVIQKKYANPFIEQRADPQIYKHTDGYYYFTASVPEFDKIILRRSTTIEGLAAAEEKVIWEKHTTGEMGAHIWAPEIHFIDGKWYIYFAAGKAEDIWAIRPYVLECEETNPLLGKWVEKGKINLEFESFSLDATTFKHEDINYLVWAQKDEANYSNIYIAKLKNPWTIEGTPVMLTRPEYDWEKVRHPVNEGPYVIKKNHKIFLTYSAAGTGKEYCIGLLAADEKSDVLDKNSWKKSPEPILASSDLDGEFGPGHNSFTVSEEGQDLLVYHARPYEGLIANNALSDPNRHTRIKRVHWNKDGTPNLKMSDEDELNLSY